jgi:hypothetical protein
MKSKQVLSIDQMKHLRELGLDTSDASMHWQFLPTVESFFNGVLALEERPTLFVSQPNMKYEYPAYTLQDILDKLPRSLNPFPSEQVLFSWTIGGNIISYRSLGGIDLCFKHFTNDLLIDAAYEMLCWCVENGYIGKENNYE